MTFVADFFSRLAYHCQNHLDFLYSPQSRLAWFYLLLSYTFGWSFYLLVARKQFAVFQQDAFGKKAWLSLSALVDFTFFTITSFALFDFFWGLKAEDVELLSRGHLLFSSSGIFPQAAEFWPVKIVWTLVPMLIGEFFFYWFHRLSHTLKPLWIFHIVHHTAPNLSPATAARIHFFDGTLMALVAGVAGGVSGSLTYLLFGQQSVHLLIYGVTFYYPLLAIFRNLHHSHIWLRYPKFLSHLFISPAMHQIHHSQDQNHFNKNFANDLALWDWLFRTLYIPAKEENKKLTLGQTPEQSMGINFGSFWSCTFQPCANFVHYLIALVRR